MIVDTKCKFCGVLLHLDIDDDYAKTNDFFKLIPLAACNRCADLRDRRSILHKRFVNLCGLVVAAGKDKEELDRIRTGLEAATKKYLKLIGDWYNRNDLAWEESMIEPFIENPGACGKHLGMFWKMSAQQQLI